MAEKKKKAAREIVGRYEYRDAAGVVIYQALAYSDGSRGVRVPAGEGGGHTWNWGRARYGVPSVPYRLPELIAASGSGAAVWVVPNERDADELAAHGIVATCCVQEKGHDGGGWEEAWTGWFKGFRLAVVICGRDKPGRGKLTAVRVLEDWHWRLRAEAARKGLCRALPAGGVKVLELPSVGGCDPFGVAQWFDAGGTVETLKAAVRGAPPWVMAEDVMELFVDAGFGMEHQEEILAALHPERAAGAKASAGRAAHERPPADSSPLPSSLPGPLTSSPGPSSVSPCGVSSAVAPAGLPLSPRPEGSAGGGGGLAGEGDPRSLASLRGALLTVMQDKSLDKFQRREMWEQVVLEWVLRRGKLFYHRELKQHASSLYFDTVDKRLSYIKRDYFGSWLSISTRINEESGDYKFIRSRIASEAMAGDHTSGIVPERFWARRGNRVYLSCGNGRMVRCSPEGAEVVDVGTDLVLFEEGAECTPWELQPGAGRNPFRGDGACEVFRTMNATYERGRMLLELWAMSLPGHGDSTKPIMLLSGRARSGKTRLALSVMDLYGVPSKATAITKTYKDTDFWTLADSGGVMCLDNADSYIDWLPGCLATVATCGSFSKKMNYKDNELITQRARCWCMVTGTQPSFAADSGVADRLLTVELYSREAGDTKESALIDDVKAKRNEALTWICRAWCRALADDAVPPRSVNSRHPDWGVTAYRLARAVNVEEEAVEAMTESEAGKAIFALRQDSLGECLLEAFSETGFKGTSQQMSDALKERCDGFDGEKTWTLPKIGKALKRLEPHLISAFKMKKKTLVGRSDYEFQPVAAELQPPTLVEVDGHFGKTAHVGAISCDFIPTPPPPPPKSFEEGGGNEDKEGFGDADGWEAL